MNELTGFLEVARDIATAGGEVALSHFENHGSPQQKADGTWATVGDLATEDLIRARLAEEFPGHNLLGEERGLTAAAGGPANEGAPTWIVDPIDGTNNYIAGIPVWATLIGLQIDGEMALGVCNAPMLGELYEGARGSGARLNGETIGVSTTADLSEAMFAFAGGDNFTQGPHQGLFGALTARCRRSRGFGDFWIHMLVARGAADIAFESELRLWDAAPLEAIVREAGGRMTQVDGKAFSDRGSCLVTNGLLHEEVVALAGSFSGPPQ